jgi:hypothetical protein
VEIGISDRIKAIVRKLRGGELPVHLAAADELVRLQVELREVKADRDYYRDQQRSENGKLRNAHTRAWHAEYRLKKAMEVLTKIAGDTTGSSTAQAEIAKAFIEEVQVGIAKCFLDQAMGYR